MVPADSSAEVYDAGSTGTTWAGAVDTYRSFDPTSTEFLVTFEYPFPESPIACSLGLLPARSASDRWIVSFDTGASNLTDAKRFRRFLELPLAAIERSPSRTAPPEPNTSRGSRRRPTARSRPARGS